MSWRILSGSLVFCSLFWCRKTGKDLRLLPGSGAGGRRSRACGRFGRSGHRLCVRGAGAGWPAYRFLQDHLRRHIQSAGSYAAAFGHNGHICGYWRPVGRGGRHPAGNAPAVCRDFGKPQFRRGGCGNAGRHRPPSRHTAGGGFHLCHALPAAPH